jgi:molybdenum cofactor cytidylyltransferase
MPESELFVAGLVLAAGGSSRLGQPKQLLPFGRATLLDHTLSTARGCRFSQLLVAIGGAADEVRTRVDLSGTQVVVNDGYGAGCSSSIAAAMAALDPRADLLVLLLGDQPGVTPDTVAELLAGRGDAALSVCRYDDGLGHPFCFSRALFETLLALHGDKAVWKLVAAGGDAVAKVHVAGPVPIDVDTWADYEAVR